MKPPALALALVSLAACASGPAVPTARFRNAPPVTAVNDRRDVPQVPSSRKLYLDIYHFDAIVTRPIDRALDLEPHHRARAVNALDEVPDSTWFTNRIGVRDLSSDELSNGPITLESPELHTPWTIKSTKPGAGDVGFVVADARGERFLIKFDPPDAPEQESATHMIVDKILWACGYNVTEDFIVHLHKEDLVLGGDASIVDMFGDKRPLDRAELDRRLATLKPEPDGRYRALASRWISGKTLGGHPSEGVRGDDPNDRIPHQLRRDLRGAYAIFAWLDHVDVFESNFLDAWVADPDNPKIHYLKHYFIDFGKSLGVMASTGHDPRRGHAYVIDLGEMAKELLEVGLVRRTWEGRSAPKLRGVGLFEAQTFDPGAWKPDYQVYAPFLVADRFDKFWGAKILIRFTRDQLRTLVDAGQFTDPRAAEYVTDTLVARQRATAAYWFARVNPLDRFTAYADRLCFDDLAIAHDFASDTTTRYDITRYDHTARALGRFGADGMPGGRACIALRLPPGGDGYTMFEITTHRPDFTGTTYVHVARDPASGTPRVIGIWRT